MMMVLCMLPVNVFISSKSCFVFPYGFSEILQIQMTSVSVYMFVCVSV